MTEQEAFEMACCEMWRGPLDKRADGRYFNGHLQARWIVWQSCAACKDAEIAELKRRLHTISPTAVVVKRAEAFDAFYQKNMREFAELKAQRDRLLEACKESLDAYRETEENCMQSSALFALRDAIAHTESGKHE
jgi:hypothetical protein